MADIVVGVVFVYVGLLFARWAIRYDIREVVQQELWRAGLVKENDNKEGDGNGKA